MHAHFSVGQRPQGKGARYHRVSTTRQETERQVADIDDWIASNDLNVAHTFEDHGSRDKAEDRPATRNRFETKRHAPRNASSLLIAAWKSSLLWCPYVVSITSTEFPAIFATRKLLGVFDSWTTAQRLQETHEASQGVTRAGLVLLSER